MATKLLDIVNKMSETDSAEEKANLSVELARAAGVPEEQIIHNNDELLAFFESGAPMKLSF